MPGTEPRRVWIQQAPEPGGLHVAGCGPYSFEICHTPAQGHVLQMWQLQPEDWPLVVWETDGYNLDEAKARAERLANEHVPVIMEEDQSRRFERSE